MDNYEKSPDPSARSTNWQDNEINAAIDQLQTDYPQFDRQTIRNELEKQINQIRPEDGIDKLVDSVREGFGRLS